ncbi:hypothetical protein HDU92_008126 [Lobulomyces angularis]|nr:hypothetical protein HDU92_008126 [Lobulomyces angularis]
MISPSRKSFRNKTTFERAKSVAILSWAMSSWFKTLLILKSYNAVSKHLFVHKIHPDEERIFALYHLLIAYSILKLIKEDAKFVSKKRNHRFITSLSTFIFLIVLIDEIVHFILIYNLSGNITKIEGRIPLLTTVSNEDCSICLGTVNDIKKLKVYCEIESHVHHEGCFTKWANSFYCSNKCPNCRRDIIIKFSKEKKFQFRRMIRSKRSMRKYLHGLCIRSMITAGFSVVVYGLSFCK